MSLKLDDPSIATAVKLGHYKDFCAALNATTDPTKKQAVKDFRTKFNSLGLTDGEEKGWVQTITATIGKTGKSINDSLTWAVALRQKLGAPILDTLRNAIDKLGPNASDWFDAFGAGANMLGGIGVIATILGPANFAWLQNVPAPSRTINPVKQCLENLKNHLKAPEIRALWTRFQGLDAAVIWALAEQVPAQLACAYAHVNTAAPQIFWLTGVADSAIAKQVAEKVYADTAYVNKPQTVNAVAVRLLTTIGQPWVKLFTCTQMADIHDTITAAYPLLLNTFFGTAGSIATSHKVVAETPDFQTWMSANCLIVVRLAHHGYPINAIMKMYDKGMGPRLMISCTWFRRQAVPASLEFFFKVWTDPNNHHKGTVHGGLPANGQHLALRHLYENFTFAEIETHNSFHPPITTAQDLVNLSHVLTLNHRNQNSVQPVGGYTVVVTNHSDVAQRRVKSFYPNLGLAHADYFTRAQVEAIRDVLALVPSNLPAL